MTEHKTGLGKNNQDNTDTNITRRRTHARLTNTFTLRPTQNDPGLGTITQAYKARTLRGEEETHTSPTSHPPLTILLADERYTRALHRASRGARQNGVARRNRPSSGTDRGEDQHANWHRELPGKAPPSVGKAKRKLL
jgi:hypothetical protein